MNNFFVTGIGTEVGKTVVSAILVAALNAGYWKPVQSGDLEHSDSDFVKELIPGVTIFPEQYRLTTAISPHASAAIDGVDICMDAFTLPRSDAALIVEGAGGILVPLNRQDTMVTLMQKLELPIILVSQNYLGSINHTLLTHQVLRSESLHIAGIIFNGERNVESESIILEHMSVPCIGRVPQVQEVTKTFVQEQAKNLNLDELRGC